jgi:hypothetical protein
MLKLVQKGMWIAALAGFVLGFAYAIWDASQRPQPANPRRSQEQAAHASVNDTRNTTTSGEAEERLAKYTLWLTLMTGILAASTVGLWIVTWRSGVRQFGDMQASVAVARDAARASRDQVELSRNAMVTTERAFIFCERIESRWNAKKDTEEITDWIFIPIWKNSGNTPTKSATSCINTWVGVNAGKLPAEFDFPDYGEPGRTMIGPGATMHGSSLSIPIETMQKIRVGEVHAYIWGWFDYSDIFDNTPRHRAEFCMEIEVHGNPIYKEGGFAYRMHERFNGFDDDCYRRPQQS